MKISIKIIAICCVIILLLPFFAYAEIMNGSSSDNVNNTNTELENNLTNDDEIKDEDSSREIMEENKESSKNGEASNNLKKGNEEKIETKSPTDSGVESVDSFEALVNAIADGKTNIKITNDIEFDNKITISTNIKIDGDNNNINRKSEYLGKLFEIKSTGTLELENIKMDLGASGWSMDYDNRYYTGQNDTGYIRVPVIDGENDTIATASLITNAGNLKITNAEIKNGRSTVSGTFISGAGNNDLKDITLFHILSAKNGGMIYASGGNTTIENIDAREGVAGLPTSSAQGGVLYIVNGNKLDIKNALIQDNFAQGNGAIFISKTNTTIDGIEFIHNRVGNDGSALNLESSVAGKTFSLSNGVFDNNIGFAVTGQSLGTIWISKWISTKEQPLTFNNVVFKNNVNRCGGGIADNGGGVTFVSINNAEEYGGSSKTQSGGFLYGQTAGYTITNSKFHDNDIAAGGAIYSLASPLTIDNCEFYNNSTEKAGGAIYASGGDIAITNSTITDNSSNTQGGAIFCRGFYDGYPTSLTIENSLIKDNSADVGGGISMVDYEGFYSKLTIDDQTKLYDNSATTASDDFQYKRNDESQNSTDNTLTLDNISIAGITGIDGWYIDSEGNRYKDVNLPEKFNDYVDYKGIMISLKAGGVGLLDYELNGGTNNDIEKVIFKYGVDTPVTSEVPEKEGYVFIGWNTKPDGTGTFISAGSIYNGKDGYILYAQYEPIPNETTNPKTGDAILLYVSTFLISIVGLGATIIFIKKND